MANLDPPTPPPQTWREFFTSPAFVREAFVLISLAITVATTQLTSCRAQQIQQTQGVAAKATADSNVNTSVLVANLKGNTEEATAKVAEAEKTRDEVKAATQQSAK